MAAGPTTPADRPLRVGTAAVTAVAAAAMVAVSFGAYYRYDVAAPLRRLCDQDDPSACPVTIVTRNAWHGWWGWLAVVAAVAATVALLSGLDRVAAAGWLVTLGLVVAAWAAVPHVADLASTERVLGGPGGGVHYGDLVVDRHAWALWASLTLAAAGFVTACARLLTQRRVGCSATDGTDDAAPAASGRPPRPPW